jgi:hypothetical protein
MQPQSSSVMTNDAMVVLHLFIFYVGLMALYCATRIR